MQSIRFAKIKKLEALVLSAFFVWKNLNGMENFFPRYDITVIVWECQYALPKSPPCVKEGGPSQMVGGLSTYKLFKQSLSHFCDVVGAYPVWSPVNASNCDRLGKIVGHSL